MDTYLKKEMQEVRLLDHATGFREKVIPVEIRTDIFTDSTTRILKFRWRPPETAKDLSFIEKSRETCPFCPERMSTSTPKFPASIVKEGQILYGRATVLPNAFPYSLYSGVIIFSEDHYVPLDQFTSEVLFDSLMAGTVYIKRIQETDHSVAYASINWNYMPPAGGGIVHPHLQVVVNEKPTRFHSRLLAASLRYKKSRGRNYWKDLISFEQNKAERYLYRYGDVVFLTSFCPGGMFGEVLTLFDESACLQDVTEDGWRDFSKGLSRTLESFHNLYFEGFNMTLLACLEKNGEFWVQTRIIPRVSLPPLGTSDVNYFEKGHDEVISIISPEDLAGDIRAFAESSEANYPNHPKDEDTK